MSTIKSYIYLLITQNRLSSSTLAIPDLVHGMAFVTHDV
jgi:hypothetical protein